MREIKFRAWDMDFRQMVPLNDAKFIDGVLIGAKGVGWDSRTVVMQYTGLKDKNGKEIYEGDIVGSKHGNSKPSEVKWGLANVGNGPRKLCFHISDNFGTDECSALGEDVRGTTDWLEIIGNIYENPELLRV